MTEISKSISAKQPVSGEHVLKDGELEAVSGGTMLSNAASNVLKSIGDALSTMARKG